jgi:hypothetical protein
MKLQAFVASCFPRPLRVILASVLPIALACDYLSQLHDVHPAAGSMTSQAIAARLAPVAYVAPRITEASAGTAGQAAVGNN